MGGIEAGLKQGSFRGLGLGLRQSVQQQEQYLCKGSSWAGIGRNAVFFDSGDYSFADQFLNLQAAGDNNNQEVDRLVDDPEDLQVNNKDSVFLPPPPPPLQPPQLAPAAAATEDDFFSVLTLPEDEGELEWLSQFMEDSFSQPYPAAAGIPIPPGNETPKSPASFSPPETVPRPRHTKRRYSAADSNASSSSSSSTTSSPWPPTSPSTPLACQSPAPCKNKRDLAGSGSGPGTGSAMLARSCSHCGTQKTPQWRAGPTGGKTLCNACGVRFKAGRLFPEYRPANSPTFSSEVHSNSHRKVLEMRKKEIKLSGKK